MERLIKIRDWDKHFEVAQSRKIEGALTWVAMPTKHDGKGYRRIMAHANGPAIFGAWCVLVQVTAKAERARRGTFADDSGPLATFDLHLKTALPESLIEETVNLLSSKEIGWLVVEEWEPTGSEVVLQNKTGQDTTEHNTTGQAPSVVVSDLEPEENPLSPFWLEVVAILESEGMGLATAACEAARANGCIPSEVRFVANHWIASKPAWSIGVLHNKVKAMRPGQKVVWPEPSAEFKNRVAAAVADVKLSKQISERKSAVNGRESAATSRADLESRFGGALDAMSKEKLHDFMVLRLPMLADSALDLPIPKGLLRSSLLYELSRPDSTEPSLPRVAQC